MSIFSTMACMVFPFVLLVGGSIAQPAGGKRRVGQGSAATGEMTANWLYLRINRIYRGPMRLFWALPAVLLAIIPAPLSGEASAAVIGGPMLQGGIEIIPSALSGVELDRVPATLSQAADSLFLMADVHAGKDEAHGFTEHAFIPYLSISYALTKENAPTFRKAGLLYPVAAKGGPHYGASAQMAGPGTYHLSYIVSPPSSHGMMRQTGKDGVSEWWKPITATWTFTYPMSAK
jgi:uncharacterized protein involved in high-affinity Fe2+ transport